MRVLLINPGARTQQRLGSYAHYAMAAPAPPTGLAYIASVLRRDGFEVRIVDQHVRRWDNPRLLREVIEPWKPDVVGYSCLTFAMEGVEEAVPLLKARLPEARVVLGNIHATYFSREVVEARLCDAAVRGEGEITMLEVCRAWREGRDLSEVSGVTWRDGETIRHNPDRPILEDLDSLPYPAWDLLADETYLAEPLGFAAISGRALSIQASRGCPYSCTFCSQDVIYPKLRKRSMKKVVAEMEWAWRTFSVSTFGFIDAIFPFSRKQLDAFAGALRERELHQKLTWFTETRVDLVNEPLLRTARDVGLRFIQFGIESGDEGTLALMNKEAGTDRARDAVRWCRELGILTFGLFVIGMPGESREQIEKTIHFAREISPDLVKFNIATPFPGARMWEQYKHRLEGQPTWKYSGWFDATLNDADHLLAGETLPASELVQLQRRAMMEFYLRPTMAWRYLKEQSLPPHRLAQGAGTLLTAYVRSLWTGGSGRTPAALS